MTAIPDDPGRGRLRGVDALRGLSIVLVVWHHLGLRLPIPTSAPQPLREALTAMGLESVYVFFAISGFLIASHSLRRWGRLASLDVRAFYLRRAARILPPLVLLLAVLAVLHLAGAAHYVIDRPGQSLPGALGAALAFRINWYESVTGYLPASWDVLWSLSVEELFYLVFPLACLTLGRTRAFVPALLLLAASEPWTRAALRGQGLWIEKADLPGLSAIACGVLAALAVRRWPRVPRALPALAGGCAAVVIAVVYLQEGRVWHLVHHATLLLLAAAAAVLCASSAWSEGRAARSRPGVTARGLGGLLAPLRACGRLSYEIYLTHMFVVWAVVDLVMARGAPGLAWPVAYAIVIVLAWGLGAVVARRVSLPAGRALRGALSRRAPAPVTATTR